MDFHHHIPEYQREVQRPVRILQLTDAHLLSDEKQSFAGIYPIASLRTILQHAQRLGSFDGVISTGDIAQESTEQAYTAYFDAVNTLNLPHYWIRGNHDESGVFFPNIHPENNKNKPIVIVRKKWCLILLNSQINGEIHGEIGVEQIENLSHLLNTYQDYHILIALHHHVFPVGCAWLDAHLLHDAESFIECISAYQQVKVVVSGHVHQESSRQYKHITFLTTPSTCIQFKKNSTEFALDNIDPGYRTFTLYADGSFDTEVLRTKATVGDIDLNLVEY